MCSERSIILDTLTLPKVVSMKKQPVHRCNCSECRRRNSSPVKELHGQINFLLSMLDERQRRLYVGLESKRIGRGGDQQLAIVTGMSAHTIAKGRRELDLAEQNDHVRAPGGGRRRVEKKIQ